MAKSMTILLAVAWLAPATAGAQPPADFTAAVVTAGNKCLIPDTRRQLRTFPCSSGGDRYWIRDGVVRTKDGYCWDHGVPQGADLSRNNAVHLVKCHGGRSQVWYFIGDGRALVQSAANSAACISVEGDQAGARAVVSPCAYQNPPPNQRFFPGERISATARQTLTAVVSAEALHALSTRGSATFSNGSRMVAAGGGNIIVATSMVAAGGGNMIQPGGGNVLPSGAGRMVAAGGGNLIGNDGGSLRGVFAGATLVR